MRVAAILLGVLITLHTPTGQEVYVNADEIMIIRSPIPYFTARGVGAEVVAHDREISVRETPAEVKRLVEDSKQQ
jgi:hypothetical protein